MGKILLNLLKDLFELVKTLVSKNKKETPKTEGVETVEFKPYPRKEYNEPEQKSDAYNEVPEQKVDEYHQQPMEKIKDRIKEEVENRLEKRQERVDKRRDRINKRINRFKDDK
jgi:gas vesicle protein